jgi:hypothetical protein
MPAFLAPFSQIVHNVKIWLNSRKALPLAF